MSRLNVQQEGVTVSEKRTLNFVAGTNITLTITDDVVNNQVDIQIDAAGGGGGAPTNADYLVGTTNASLSAEIVVGTAPGGELGGTWASPTVDATHSGSSHAATQAAAEATAASALTTHEADTSTHGVADLTALITAAGVTYENLNANLDVGTGATQVAQGNHTHAGGAGVATDTIWDAVGDLALGNGADAAVRLPIGADATVLTSNGTTASWQTPGAASHPSIVSHLKWGVD